MGDRRLAGGTRELTIPLGGHVTLEAAFTPDRAGDVSLTLVSRKAGKEQFRDVRRFRAE